MRQQDVAERLGPHRGSGQGREVEQGGRGHGGKVIAPARRGKAGGGWQL
jgi:hypothetical protein